MKINIKITYVSLGIIDGRYSLKQEQKAQNPLNKSDRLVDRCFKSARYI